MTAEQNQREQRRTRLGQRIDATPDEQLPERLQEFYDQLQRYLRQAFTDSVLDDSLDRILSLLKRKKNAAGNHEIYGGFEGTDFRRESTEKFQRDDGAMINFKMTISEKKNQPLEILAYSFEICFPERLSPRFVRFDLNFDNHQNDQEETLACTPRT